MGEQLRPMRRLEGREADCLFCGEDQANVASDVWEQDGELLDWVVCLWCGTSNPRRVAHAPQDGGGQPS